MIRIPLEIIVILLYCWGFSNFSYHFDTLEKSPKKASQLQPRGTLDADRCSIFFVDDMRKEVWCVGSLDMDAMALNP